MIYNGRLYTKIDGQQRDWEGLYTLNLNSKGYFDGKCFGNGIDNYLNIIDMIGNNRDGVIKFLKLKVGDKIQIKNQVGRVIYKSNKFATVQLYNYKMTVSLQDYLENIDSLDAYHSKRCKK